jgi:D-glycero-alpha-D-manno-heptose-7-phosphate kinase
VRAGAARAPLSWRPVVIRAKTPLRVSFAGGGTDVPPFPEREGGLVLNATISRYTYGTLVPRFDEEITIESVDLGTNATFGLEDALAFDGQLDLIKAAIRHVGGRYPHGFELFLHSNAPPGSGLGSSSSMMVTLVGLLKEFRNLPLTDYQTAALAHRIERDELGIMGGLQDHYSTTFGGFNFIEFGADAVTVNPLRIPTDTVLELEQNLLLCFTGTTRQSDHIIEDQTSRFEGDDTEAVEGLRRQKALAVEMKDALLQRRLHDFGALLHEAWEAKKRMSNRISNDRIDMLYETARSLGAIGGKVTGAGGGGFMLFQCDYRSKHRVAQAMTELGAPVQDFAFEPAGLRTWRAS